MTIIFPIVVIAWVNAWIGLVIVILCFCQVYYLLWASHKVDIYRQKSREVYRKNSGVMSDIISNIQVVKSAAQEDSSVERVAVGAEVEATLFTKRYLAQAKMSAGREALTVLTFAIVLMMTVTFSQQSSLGLAGAVLIVTYVSTILMGIYALNDDLDAHDDFIDKILPAISLFEHQNTVEDPPDPEDFAKPLGSIRFDRVNFSYTGQPSPVLKDFSLKIQPQQKVGVVGLSGAGKSTLTKLLLRFNDVTDGAVLVDNHDVRSVRQADLRRNIAYVPQEPLLFHASIRENVAVSKNNASDEEIYQALKTAYALSFVEELPDGILSIVGERGVKLSGGQKQRIAIARVVLREAPIMILDESTSALDSESEAIIKSSFKEVLHNKMAIVVAHRLSTLSDMDRIIVIDNGQIVEDGTHSSLLESNGRYADLWRRQLLGNN